MTSTLPDKACAIRLHAGLHGKDLLLKRQFKNRTWTKGMCYDITYSHFRYLFWLSWKTISNRTIDSHMGLKAYCQKIHLTPLIKVEFQSSV